MKEHKKPIHLTTGQAISTMVISMVFYWFLVWMFPNIYFGP